MSAIRPPFWNPELGFRRSPFLHIGVAFAAGIALATRLAAVPPWAWLIAFSLVLCLSLIALYFRHHWLSLLLALSSVALGGLLWMLLREELKPPQHIDRYFQSGLFDNENPVELIGALETDPERRSDKVTLYLRLEQLTHGRRAVPVEGTVRLTVYSTLYAPEDFFPAGLYYGDRVRALVRLRRPRSFQNPGAFDYADYLQANDVHAVASAKSPLLIGRLDRRAGWAGLRAVQAVRRWMMRRFETYLATPERSTEDQVAAVVIALVIGERTSLSPAVEETFKRTGTYHVLVISGLHVVALVYVLAWLLRRARVPEIVQAPIIMLVLLFYTLLAGARPSILRAAVMVSTYLMGSLLFRERRFLNATCLSAVILLLINPAWLWDVGFQLTFAAVLTICLAGAPLVDAWIAPWSRGLSSVFSEVISVNPSPAARRTRRVRFTVELWIERMEDRLPAVSRAVWERLMRVVAWLAHQVGGLALMSLVIQCVMLALMVSYFHRVTLISPLANLLVVPLTTGILFLAVLLLPVSLLSAKGAWLLAGPIKLLVKWTLACVEAGARWRFAEYRVPTPPVWVTLGFLLFLLAAVALRRPPWRRTALALFAVFLFLLCVHPLPAPYRPGILAMTALDVGQGDAIFLQFPRGRTMLVDGGGLSAPGEQFGDTDDGEGDASGGFDVGEQVVAPFLWSRGIQRLDYVALTHAHHDHIGGLPFIIDHFSVGALLDGRNPTGEAEYARLRRKAAARGVPQQYLRRGDVFSIDGVEVEVLNPAVAEPAHRVSNDDSLILRLRYGRQSFLLTGDVERRIEAELSGFDCAALRANVLKVPHHGSRTSSTDPFVACVEPQVAVISAGADNPFGHPSHDVLARYRSRAVTVHQTALHGAITIQTDGQWLATARGRRSP